MTVTEATTRADIAEAIGHVNHRAKREWHVTTAGTDQAPTAWDERHSLIDSLLTALERVRA